ncbi:MAG: protein-L-isoaspartate(D-aspartate) O-methyltransferase [Crocinitomicaceae bacterium]|nr:protein-L-isoaspartate(D-aspartate) O-methyltransferase [Crocinitomicaceae bacterium]
MRDDSYRHKGLRKKMILELKEKGISDEKILNAFDLIPRHFFLDLAFVEKAYTNMAFQIGAKQTISHPFTVGFQTQLLNLKKGEKVLEIGTGSGFQTCILCCLGARVYSVERQKQLHLTAQKIIDDLGYSPKLFYGDGYKGLNAFMPFDKILVTCGAPNVPELLKKQLKVGGILVIPIGDGDSQTMKKITKVSENEYQEEDFGVFRFVPMLERKAK